MPHAINRVEVQGLVGQGAQLVEVLPDEEYAEEHLAGAIHLPLGSLTVQTPTSWTGPDRSSSTAGTPSAT